MKISAFAMVFALTVPAVADEASQTKRNEVPSQVAPYIGIGAEFVAEMMKTEKRGGMETSTEIVDFVYTKRLVCGGPAHKAGLHMGEKVDSVNGVPVSNGRLTRSKLKEVLDGIKGGKVGDPVIITVIRRYFGRRETLTINIPRAVIENPYSDSSCNSKKE